MIRRHETVVTLLAILSTVGTQTGAGREVHPEVVVVRGEPARGDQKMRWSSRDPTAFVTAT